MERSAHAWRWKGLVVKLVDGATAAIADTPANQAEYPQNRRQKLGLGYPLVRLIGVFSLSSAAVLNTAMAPFRGKGTGEPSLFRSLLDHLKPEELILADRYYCSFCLIALLAKRQVQCLFRLHQLKRFDRRRKLGRGDWLVDWTKPRQRPLWMELSDFRKLPDRLLLRLVEIRVQKRGYRTRRLTVVTTLLDQTAYPLDEIAELYRKRWHVEGDLRDLKQTLAMAFIDVKYPELARKTILVHLLAYNFLRSLMLRSSLENGIAPRNLSFACARQLLQVFELVWAAFARTSLELVLNLLACYRVGNRPGRSEPRLIKFRTRKYKPLTKPRALARRHLNSLQC